jgi:tripartite-type tricarboxylate transporter receptor subunit TctC
MPRLLLNRLPQRNPVMKPLHTLAALLGALLLNTGAALADTFPSKPVTLMVPYPAGGLSDIIARKVNQPLAAELKQPVIIENLGGAGGAIAAQKVLGAPADGHMIFQGSPNELILAPLALKAVKHKPEDFRLIQNMAQAPLAIVARKGFAASNPAEMVAEIRRRAREGKPVSYASVGNGSFYHLLGEALSRKLGAEMLHVPYKGGGPILQDLLGEQVDLFITPYGAPHVAMDKEGKIKFIAALSAAPQRLIAHVAPVDQVPELKGFHYTISSGYYVKKGTPEAVVAQLHRALTKVMFDADFRQTMAQMGQDVGEPLRLEDAAAVYARDVQLYQGIARSIGLQAQ